MTPDIGDKLCVPGFLGTQHVGIYVGPLGGRKHGVVHNDKRLGVVLAELSDFAAGRSVWLEKKGPPTRAEKLEVSRRALALVGTQYDLLNFNCEHLVTFAQEGKASSTQVRAIAVVVLLFVAALMATEA